MAMTPVRLALSLPATWERIAPTVQAMQESLDHAGAGAALRDALGMTCSELLENAVKYGLPAPAVEVLLVVEEGHCTLTVTNPVQVPSAHPLELAQRVTWLASVTDPEEAYSIALLQTSQGGRDTGNLGLVRIVHEGGCQLSADISRPGWVTVNATRDVDSPA